MLRFGVAGFPPAFGRSPRGKDRVAVFEWLAELGLNAFEIQMTYGPRSSKELCEQYAKAAGAVGVRLSIHASYFIVLTSSDQTKIRNSIDTLARTFELASVLGAKEIVLHPGPLYGGNHTACMSTLIDNLKKFFDLVGKTSVGLFLETAGKVGQFGSVEEVLEVSRIVAGTYPCIDFGHVHARTGGTLSNHASIGAVFELLRRNGALASTSRIHFHYTPIDYGLRGEIKHKSIVDRYDPPAQSDLFGGAPEGLYHPRFEPIAEALSAYDLDCTVISETHDTQEQGAIAMRDHYLLHAR